MTPAEFLAARHRAGLTQVAAARWIGVAAATVAHWERGRRPVPEYAALAVVRAPRKTRREKISGDR